MIAVCDRGGRATVRLKYCQRWKQKKWWWCWGCCCWPWTRQWQLLQRLQQLSWRDSHTIVCEAWVRTYSGSGQQSQSQLLSPFYLAGKLLQFWSKFSVRRMLVCIRRRHTCLHLLSTVKRAIWEWAKQSRQQRAQSACPLRCHFSLMSLHCREPMQNLIPF